MDREVAKTLAELELKLRDLERELTTIGRRAAEPAQPSPSPRPMGQAPPPGAGTRRASWQTHHAPPPPSAPPPPPSVPPPNVPPAPNVSTSPPSVPPPPNFPPAPGFSEPANPFASSRPGAPGRLVDEAVEPAAERRYSMEAQETAFGEIPATKDERQAIELGELVRFREEMQRTLQGLIDEYSRLLSLRPRA